MTPRLTVPGWVLVYDGHCRVCTRAVAALTRWDREGMLELVPSHTPGLTLRFPSIAPAAYAESMQLIAPDGRTWQGAAAVEQLLELLPRGALFSWLFRLPFAGRLADQLYRWFARNRHRLGCGVHCAPRGPTSPGPPVRHQETSPGSPHES